MRSRIRNVALIVGLGLVGPGGRADAGLIQYSLQGQASGTINGSPFALQRFTILLTGDTSFANNANPIQSIETGFSRIDYLVNNMDYTSLSIFQVTLILDKTANSPSQEVLIFSDPYDSQTGFSYYPMTRLLSYNFGTPLSPTPMNPPFNSLTDMVDATSGQYAGSLVLSNFSGVTFGALAIVPEPSSLLMAATGLASALGVAARSRRKG